MKQLLWGLVLLLFCPQAWATNKVIVPLKGDWEFRQLGKEEWLPAEVPGCVHTDLLANGKIPDPFAGSQEANLQWIEDADWEYRLEFHIPRRTFRFGHMELFLEGLDTYADVYINDSLLLQADNMFRTWDRDIKSYLKIGSNEVRIVFYSPVRRTVAERMMYPYPLPADNDARKEKASVFTRKAPFQFGWDFGPRFLSMGVWRPIYLRLWDHHSLEDLQFRVLSLEDDLAVVDGMAFVKGEGAGEFPTELTIKLDGKAVWDTSFQMRGREEVIPFYLKIPNPKKWWPRGYGDPHLYNIRATLGKSGNIEDSLALDYGLRTVELVREYDQGGRSFYFKVNGQPIFVKGANYIPEDVFLHRAAEKQKALLEMALEANMNMLRIWGGGIYQSNEFYEWCDQHGILVWQDLMFACSMYPHGPAFHNQVTDEVIDEFLRLRNHPSIAIWCGNNEIDVAWKNWGWQAKMGYARMDSFNLYQGYQELFQEIIPQLVENYDPDRPYVHTSPLSNWGKMENFKRHSMHYWGVWHGADDFDAYQTYVPRFMSEYGMQSYPAATSLLKYAEETDLELGSEWINNRQKSYKGNDFLFAFTERWLGTPRDTRTALLMSQVTQQVAMEYAIEAHRSAAPFCMGTLYWQMNDCWPGPSWSTIDYTGRKKAAHYALKRLYAPQLLTTRYQDGALTVSLVDELSQLSSSDEVHFMVLGLNGGVMGKGKLPAVQIKEGGMTAEVKVTESAILKNVWKKRKAVAVLTWERNGKQIARKILHTLPMPKIKLPEPEFEYAVDKGPGGVRVQISSASFAKSVRLQLKGDDQAEFSDQFFDLLPGESKEVLIYTSLNPTDAQAGLSVESLYDWRKP